ncbi:MAG: sugar kinase [Planctomycetes bacterium]|nr:sugar kinase [Planctomycetota bacterium]
MNDSPACLSVGLLVADHICAPIPHLPQSGQLVLTDRLELTTGGCASNVAMDLARVGVKSGLIGCVGDDAFAQFVIDTHRDAGIAVDGIRRIAGVGTAGTMIINVTGQDRRFIHALGANAALSADDIPLDLVRRSRVLYVGGYLLMAGLDPARLGEVFRAARAAGVTTVLDVVLPGPGDYWPQLGPVLTETDVFLPNRDEAAIITGAHDPKQQALRLREAGAGTVVITAGDEGLTVVSGERRLLAAAHRMPFVGGTGAGDAFVAGYIAGLLDEGSLEQCLAWGAALGASCVRSISATASVFTRPEAIEFIQQHPLQIESW